MAKSKFCHVRISGVTGVIPEKCVNIDDEIAFYGDSDKLLKRNKKILGLGTRYVADAFTTNADLCQAAAENLFSEMGIDRQTIDALIVGSTSHDYVYPASACILQGRLGLSEDCTCYDQSGLGCTAYVHALWQAHAIVESGAAKRVLVLVGDVVSRHSDYRNRNVNMLFGDAGTATLVEWSEVEIPAWFVTGTRGKGWTKIIAPAGGMALPIRSDIAAIELADATGNVWHLWEDIMRGMEVFRFTTEAGPKSVKDVLALSGKSLEDVEYFAFHQANKQIVNTVSNFIGLDAGKYSTETFTKYANCSAASVATDLLREFSGSASRVPGLTCLVTFGIGLSWGTALVDLAKTHFGGLKTYVTPEVKKVPREQQIAKWISYFKGETDVS